MVQRGLGRPDDRRGALFTAAQLAANQKVLIHAGCGGVGSLAIQLAKSRGAFVFIGPNAAVLSQLATLADAGSLRPIAGAEFALADIAKAHALSQSGRTVGKIGAGRG